MLFKNMYILMQGESINVIVIHTPTPLKPPWNPLGTPLKDKTTQEQCGWKEVGARWSSNK